MAVEIENVGKKFGRNVVLQDFVVVLEPGNVYSIVGENGAGKSTLMKIIAGIYTADAGSIRKDGKLLKLSSPASASEEGIAMVHQEHNLIPDMTVLENVFLGREIKNSIGKVDKKAARVRYKEAAERLDIKIDPSRFARTLSVAESKMVEILKACIFDLDVLILDEPTAALGDGDVKTLTRIIHDLRANDKIIIYVSHRLAETFAICDYVSVLKDGKLVGTWPTTETNESELANRMVGREITDIFPVRQSGASESLVPVLSVKGFTNNNDYFDIDMEVQPGEVVGIGGMAGHGQREFVRSLFGLQPWTHGTMQVGSREIKSLRSPRNAINAGIAFITDDRRNEGLAVTQPVFRNVGLPSLRKETRAGVFSRKAELKRVAKLVERLNVKLNSVCEPASVLSGGNQQRLMFAKWLPTQPKVLLVHEPTLGVDIGAKQEIYKIIRDLTAAGMGVLMVTSDLVELLNLSDRIVVFYEGRISGEFLAEGTTEEDIMHAALALSSREELPI